MDRYQEGEKRRTKSYVVLRNDPSRLPRRKVQKKKNKESKYDSDRRYSKKRLE